MVAGGQGRDAGDGSGIGGKGAYVGAVGSESRLCFVPLPRRHGRGRAAQRQHLRGIAKREVHALRDGARLPVARLGVAGAGAFVRHGAPEQAKRTRKARLQWQPRQQPRASESGLSAHRINTRIRQGKPACSEKEKKN